MASLCRHASGTRRALPSHMNWHMPMALWWIVGPFVAWRVWVRLRRLLAVQRYSRLRQLSCAAGLVLLVAAVAAVAFEEYAAVLSLGIGLVVGSLLGWLGIRLTTFDREPESGGITFKPDPWLGLALALLLLGRIVWRLVVGPSDGSTGWTAAEFIQNPSTMFLFGLFSAHFTVHSLGVVRWVARHRTEMRRSSPAEGGR